MQAVRAEEKMPPLEQHIAKLQRQRERYMLDANFCQRMRDLSAEQQQRRKHEREAAEANACARALAGECLCMQADCLVCKDSIASYSFKNYLEECLWREIRLRRLEDFAEVTVADSTTPYGRRMVQAARPAHCDTCRAQACRLGLWPDTDQHVLSLVENVFGQSESKIVNASGSSIYLAQWGNAVPPPSLEATCARPGGRRFR